MLRTGCCSLSRGCSPLLVVAGSMSAAPSRVAMVPVATLIVDASLRPYEQNKYSSLREVAGPTRPKRRTGGWEDGRPSVNEQVRSVLRHSKGSREGVVDAAILLYRTKSKAATAQTYISVLEGIRDRKEVKAARALHLKFLNSPKTRSTLTLPVYNALIAALCAGGDIERALSVLYTDLKAFKLEASAESYVPIIAAYGREGNIASAKEVFENMELANIKPTAAAFEGLLLAYSRKGEVKGAEEAMALAQSIGVPPSPLCLASLIRTYAVAGDSAQVSALTATYGEALGVAGRRLVAGSAVLAALARCDDKAAWDSLASLKAEGRVSQRVLRALADRSRERKSLTDASAILTLMQTAVAPLDAKTLGVLAAIHLDAGDVQGAEEVLSALNEVPRTLEGIEALLPLRAAQGNVEAVTALIAALRSEPGGRERAVQAQLTHLVNAHRVKGDDEAAAFVAARASVAVPV